MNEKAIVKRMKAAAKAAGCKIWRNEHDVLVLCGGGWCFVCEWGNCPPAVLGCLAEWLHGLPCPGSGYWYKGYPDPEPLDCQPPELAALIGRSGEDLILSPLRTETLQLAQTRTGQMYWFSTDLTAMLGTLATTGGGTLLPAKDETQMPWAAGDGKAACCSWKRKTALPRLPHPSWKPWTAGRRTACDTPV